MSKIKANYIRYPYMRDNKYIFNKKVKKIKQESLQKVLKNSKNIKFAIDEEDIRISEGNYYRDEIKNLSSVYDINILRIMDNYNTVQNTLEIACRSTTRILKTTRKNLNKYFNAYNRKIEKDYNMFSINKGLFTNVLR